MSSFYSPLDIFPRFHRIYCQQSRYLNHDLHHAASVRVGGGYARRMRMQWLARRRATPRPLQHRSLRPPVLVDPAQAVVLVEHESDIDVPAAREPRSFPRLSLARRPDGISFPARFTVRKVLRSTTLALNRFTYSRASRS